MRGLARGDTAETVLGTVRLLNAMEGECQVLVRPEWIARHVAGTPLRVVTSRFEGAQARVTLEAPDGTRLFAIVPSWDAVSAGDDFDASVAMPLPAFTV